MILYVKQYICQMLMDESPFGYGKITLKDSDKQDPRTCIIGCEEELEEMKKKIK